MDPSGRHNVGRTNIAKLLRRFFDAPLAHPGTNPPNPHNLTTYTDRHSFPGASHCYVVGATLTDAYYGRYCHFYHRRGCPGTRHSREAGTAHAYANSCSGSRGLAVGSAFRQSEQAKVCHQHAPSRHYPRPDLAAAHARRT
jgi:hypothetical protein